MQTLLVQGPHFEEQSSKDRQPGFFDKYMSKKESGVDGEIYIWKENQRTSQLIKIYDVILIPIQTNKW